MQQIFKKSNNKVLRVLLLLYVFEHEMDILFTGGNELYG